VGQGLQERKKAGYIKQDLEDNKKPPALKTEGNSPPHGYGE
jgi:hypothetical protein